MAGILAHMNETLIQSSNSMGFSSATNKTLKSHRLFYWTQDNINTVAYITLAILCVMFIGVLSAFYAR